MDFSKIKDIVKDLPEQDAKRLLQLILLKIMLLEKKEISSIDFTDDLKKIYGRVVTPEVQYETKFEKGKVKKVHILFGYPYLSPILKDLGLYEEEYMITFQDNFAVGPLSNVDNENGQKERYDWIKKAFNEYEDDYIMSFQRIITTIDSIPDHVPIDIWISNNAHEQTGLLFTLYLLREKKNNISIVNTGQLYRKLFEKKSKRYVPFFSGGIVPEELQAIYEYNQENQNILTASERKQYETQWSKLSNSPVTLRIWENNEITNVSEGYYDPFIIEKAKKLIGKKKGFIKSARLIGEVLGQISQYITDNFFEYRVRKLIEKGIFDYEGSLEAMRYYGIKISKS